MKKEIKVFIILFVFATTIFLYLICKPEKVDRRAPWHPFKLNSELTLKSIVKDGYRFNSSPCGFVQYTKELGDTIIQYEVYVDCNKYKKKYSTPFLADLKTFMNSNIKANLIPKKANKTIEEEITENKFYPWNINEISNCYQKINWRVFTIHLGKTLDYECIRDFVFKKNGYIINDTIKWNADGSGSFMVYHSDSYLYFYCTITNNKRNNDTENDWEFQIIRHIPSLNQKTIQKG